MAQIAGHPVALSLLSSHDFHVVSPSSRDSPGSRHCRVTACPSARRVETKQQPGAVVGNSPLKTLRALSPEKYNYKL